MEEIYLKPPNKNYPTNKTNVYHFDDIWSFDILDLKDYGPENIRGCRFFLFVFDNFSKFVWTVPLKNKNAQTIKDFFEKILISLEGKPTLIETDLGKQFHNIFFQNFLNNHNVKHQSTNSSLGAVLQKDLFVLLEIFLNYQF